MFKKMLLVLAVAAFSFGLAGSAVAQDAEVAEGTHAFELGTEISHIIYREPGLMEEEGMMYGVVGSYTYRLNELMLKAEGKSSWGSLDYYSPISGTMDDIGDYMLELRGLGGYDFAISENTTLTPYIGVGYRYLKDDAADKYSSVGHYGYEREANYWYSPIGLETVTELGNGWSLGVAAEYDLFWWGIQKSHEAAGDSFHETVLESEQEKGYGIRGSVKIQKEGEKVDFAVEPFVRYWKIKDSEKSLFGYEPKNSSLEIGSKFAVRF